MSANVNCASCGKNRQEAECYGDLTGACCSHTNYCPCCHAVLVWCRCDFGRYLDTLPTMALRDLAVGMYYKLRDGVANRAYTWIANLASPAERRAIRTTVMLYLKYDTTYEHEHTAA